VPFPYYDKLKPKQKAIYRRSDDIKQVRLPEEKDFRPMVGKLEEALLAENRGTVEKLTRQLTAIILEALEVEPVTIKVLSARPSDRWGELHGLYEGLEKKRRARITVWMRTAHHKKVVAFKTYLRTILHEICHHLDYELLKLEDSFHTEGFFKRESSLFHQLLNQKH